MLRRSSRMGFASGAEMSLARGRLGGAQRDQNGLERARP